MEYRDKTNYSKFQQSQVKKLQSKRNGWFSPTYELIDGQFSYGLLSYHGFFNTTTQIDTANITWLIRSSSILVAQIITSEGVLVGRLERKWFSSKIIFTSEDGFTAVYSVPSMWKSEYIWQTKDGQTLLKYMGGNFTDKESYVFADLIYQQQYLLLLAFLTLDFNLRNRRGAAARITAATG